MGRITDVAPAGLVPAAWLVTIGAHAGVVSTRAIFVALVVMDVLLVAFFLASLGEMTGILRVWRYVIVGGLAANLAGTADMAFLTGTTDAALAGAGGSFSFLPVTLYAWMVLPGLAYVPTGMAHDDRALRNVYLAAAALSVVGAELYAVGHLGGLAPTTTMVGGLATVGVGQTLGIVTAVRQNS